MTDIIRYEQQRLSNIEEALRMLAEAKTITEVTHIRDYYEARRLVIRQAKAGLEVQNQAAEVKLRAERRAGEMLATMDKQDGGDAMRKKAQSQAMTELPPKLDDLNISKNQSSAWQQIAAIPDDDFEQHIAQIVPPARVRGTGAAFR